MAICRFIAKVEINPLGNSLLYGTSNVFSFLSPSYLVCPHVHTHNIYIYIYNIYILSSSLIYNYKRADCPLPANRGPCYNVDAQVTLSLAATPGGMIEEKFHEMMGMSIATDRLDRILHDIDPGSMLICSTATQPGHKHATGAISAPSRVLIRGKYSATSNMHRGDASVIHRSFGMMVLALGITAAIISTIFTRRRSAKESSSRIVINPPFTEASNVASQNLRKKEKAPEADLLASKALHPIIDLETGENGESLLSDLPQGRLGVVHSIGVLDPSTGQLIVRSDHGASAFSASDDVFFSEFEGTLHQALANSKQQGEYGNVPELMFICVCACVCVCVRARA